MGQKERRFLLELLQRGEFPDSHKHSVRHLLGGKKIILYGAGAGCITFFVFILKKYGLTAAAVLDRNVRTGETFWGIPVYSPRDFVPTEEDRAGSVVVVTVGKTEYHKEILDDLRDMGFLNVLFAAEIYEYHLPHASQELVEKGIGFYLEKREAIIEGFDLLADDLSAAVYVQFMQTHMERRPTHISCHPLHEQYFPEDVDLSQGSSRYIGCGAYDGDTVRQLNVRKGKVDAVACFEPDLRNYEHLVAYLTADWRSIAETVITFPCGVYSRECQLPFASGNESNSMISASGSSFIQCVALDHVLLGFCPTYITMDIEGAEIEALHGAEGLIRQSRPDLAICVYHAPDHIWKVPIHLHGLNLGYKFYLRNYTGTTSETVLYATRRI